MIGQQLKNKMAESAVNCFMTNARLTNTLKTYFNEETFFAVCTLNCSHNEINVSIYCGDVHRVYLNTGIIETVYRGFSCFVLKTIYFKFWPLITVHYPVHCGHRFISFQVQTIPEKLRENIGEYMRPETWATPAPPACERSCCDTSGKHARAAFYSQCKNQ
jgi:hypothetical protein